MLYKTILCLIFFGGIFSCKKIDCPEPISSKKAAVKSDTINPAKPGVQRYVVLLQPGSEGKDAVLSNTYSDQNFSTSTYLHARAWTVNSELSLEKSIIQFDYSSIPTGAIISKAILILYADTTINTGSIGHSKLIGDNDWVIKRVTQSWNEETVTWNDQPEIDLTSEIQCAASESQSQSYVQDVTPWVLDEIANPTLYYGFLMQLNSIQPYKAINFCSSDNKYPSLRPGMLIIYDK